MTAKPVEEEKPSGSDKILVAKWGKPLIASGFTVLPDVIFLHQKALKLTRLDVLIILHLAKYWWKPNELARPAVTTIADAIDVEPRTVQRAIKKMEGYGYVKRIYRKAGVGDNLPNAYDLNGLVKAASKIAEEELAKKAKRAAEEKSKRATPKAFALIDGGK